MLRKIILLLFILASLVLAYFAYPIIRNRYFKTEIKQVIKFDEKKSEDIKPATDSNNIPEDSIKDEIDESGEIGNISAKDCDNGCENFKNNSSDLKYCQDICDLSPVKESENCENLQTKEKDYCLKNQAVTKIDLKICNLISDSTIKSACKNRVMEELLERQ